MALKLIESFDGQRTYSQQKWNSPTAPDSGAFVSAPAGQSGTWFSQTAGAGAAQRFRDVSYTGDTLIAGMRIELPATNPGGGVASPLATFYEYDGTTTTAHVYINWSTAGFIEARLGVEGTVIGTGTVAIPFGTGCRYMELKVKVHNSAGTVEVRIDEVVYLSLSGVDTQNGGTSRCNAFHPMGQRAGGGQTSWKFRDIYVCGTDGSANNDFLGVFKTGVKTINGAGASAQFTPSAGSNFQNVDDGTTVDNDTTYNESSTVDHVDTHALTSSGLPSGAVVRGTQTSVIMRKTDADPRGAASVIRSGGSNFAGATVSLGTSFLPDREVQEVDPNTSAAWTQANLDAVELGYKVVS